MQRIYGTQRTNATQSWESFVETASLLLQQEILPLLTPLFDFYQRFKPRNATEPIGPKDESVADVNVSLGSSCLGLAKAASIAWRYERAT
jgi:hypothetical protein